MAYALRIVSKQGDLRKLDGTFKRIRKQIPVLTSEAMMTWGHILVKDMKNAAKAAGIKPMTGTLFGRGIRWDQRPNGRIGKLFIRQYGIMLDQMDPHYVNITRRRTRLLRWAEQAREARISKAARQVIAREKNHATIYVRPHPFTMKAWRIARPKIRTVLNAKLKKLQ